MSLREKAGQLIMAEIKAISPRDAKRNNIGGLLNSGGSWPTDEPGSPVDWLAMADLYYNESVNRRRVFQLSGVPMRCMAAIISLVPLSFHIILAGRRMTHL